ncbi:MAG TPA: IPTL-CTERM sorting domain-containing protein [Thermoanaerobaculia bacterium]|jgi:parallel beta-helix repeat protein|nr:IPTL-CTERM sorting domain-containing protein [Thermoanaerobaculia bacterium]
MARKLRRSLPPSVGSGLVILLVLAFPARAGVTTFLVTTLADSGPGSLRQAVLDANSATGADEVVFTVSGTITLTSGEVAITDDLTIVGPGPGTLTVSGNGQSRIFNVDDGADGAIDVTLSGLTLTRGYAQGFGGAVLTADENLTIRGSVISDSVSDNSSATESGCGGNVAIVGRPFPSSSGGLRIEDSTLTGGVANAAPDQRFFSCAGGGNVCALWKITLERSILSGGSAQCGGGLYGVLGSILNSTISGNTAEAGGGIYSSRFVPGTTSGSTISGNTAEFVGGGIYVDSGETLFINSTISGNTAGLDGGGIYAPNVGDGQPGSFVTLRLTTVSNNTAARRGGSLHQVGENGGFDIDHSIVANGVPEDINSSFGYYVANYSLIEDSIVPPVFGSNNIFGVDPLLGPLANNGGPTLTHALLPGSPAIDAGNPAIQAPPPTDQRGFARIYGPAIDLGAVEAQPLDVIAVPTLSQIGTLLLSALLVATGMWRLRRGALKDG